MARFTPCVLVITNLISTCWAFVDFGTITQPLQFAPTFTVAVPRPYQLPDDVWMRYGEYYSQITAVAPSVYVLPNGSHATSWSLHSHLQPTKTVEDHGGLRRRGVFSGDPPSPSCRQCDQSGNPIGNGNNSNSSNSGSPICSQVNYNVSAVLWMDRPYELTGIAGHFSIWWIWFDGKPSRLLLQPRL